VISLAAWLLVALGLGFGALGSPDTLVRDGERWWRQSPDPGNPVACATCHHDPAATRGWAASFPKVKPFPPPHTRVMTLLQANAEAVRRHYRLVDPRAAAAAITAYLAAKGAGVPLSPGVATGQPVFLARLRALGRSVARGRQIYTARCAPCHDVAAFVSTVVAIPRSGSAGAQSLEGFLEAHATNAAPLGWDSQAMADLLGYLTAARANRPRKERS
jgi:cytochrome c553